MDCRQPIASLDRVTPALVASYQRLGIETVGDLLGHCPNRYDDFTTVTPIIQLQPGPVTVRGVVSQAAGRYTRFRGLHVTEALVTDATASIRAVWYNQPYRARQFQPGQEHYLSGQYRLQNRRLVLLSPSTQQVVDNQTPADLLRAIYPTTAGLSQLQIRRHLRRLKDNLPQLAEPWPDWLVTQAGLRPYAELLADLHFPASLAAATAARRELGRRQMMVVALASTLLRVELGQQKFPPVRLTVADLLAAARRLEFQLTDEQLTILRALIRQLRQAQAPLNCLLHGDVGSGKTIVAGLLAQLVIAGGGQVALMAPTEILADQHYRGLRETFARTWSGQSPLRLVQLAGRQPAKELAAARAALANGQTQLVVGTHSLLNQANRFANLQLVIIDEQHRFGVAQRQRLLQQAGWSPHCLSLSATPIPRSLALVLYGELDIYRLTAKPPGRQPIKTQIVALDRRPQLWRQILEPASPDHQVYIVCPAITSEAIGDTVQQTARTVGQFLPPEAFAVLHGQLTTPTKLDRARAFWEGRLSVLVTTSMVEAGLDNPNVQTIVILSPERFGLAQLHQLRGRVGRGDKPGVCYLAPLTNDSPSERLVAVRDHDDGFALSELDLKLRGPGSLYGTQQWGRLNLDLAPWLDEQVVAQARELADLAVERIQAGQLRLADYPELAAAVATAQSLVHLN